MIIIVCADQKNGLMFAGRRQSMDRVLRERILEKLQDRKLRMSSYSARQFQEAGPEQLLVSEDFLETAGEGDVCFTEGQNLAPHICRIEKLILYRWDKVYPADFYLDLDLTGGPDGCCSGGECLVLAETEEFAGYSHEKITEEVYVKTAR
ncbi:MAG: hypothetical protein ACI4LA_05315 [Emergencia sp.]